MTVLAVDPFTRANGSLGGNWSTITGTSALTIVSNTVQATGAAFYGGAAWSALAWPPDQYSEITIGTMTSTVTASGMQPAVRVAAGALSFYQAEIGGPTGSGALVTLYQVIAGAFTFLGSASGVVWQAGDRCRLLIQGAALTVMQNGQVILGPITDGALTAGSPGMLIYIDTSPDIANTTIDAWEGGAMLRTARPFGLP